MFTLTNDILIKIAPTLSKERAVKLSALITEVCPLYGIDNANALHEFLANMLWECGEFRIMEENLNYSAKRLLQGFSSRFANLEMAPRY